MELLRHLDLQATARSRPNDRVGLAEFMRDGGLREYVQSGLHRHQTDFAIGCIVYTHNADFRGCLADQTIHVSVPGHTKALAQSLSRSGAAAPDRDSSSLMQFASTDPLVRLGSLRASRGKVLSTPPKPTAALDKLGI